MATGRKTAKEHGNRHQKVKEILGSLHACYILITCDPLDDEGHMQVEMSYEGDEDLASYLLEGAQQHFIPK